MLTWKRDKIKERTACLSTRTKKLVREISGSYVNNEELTTIWVG
jgi:hypothetical protein